ncbi:MAG TPA: hypothetical protein ENO00_12050 [Deltaproteobacteria bacterium]|nr:hypothetical protein [Deltaproteobacteria bacterium]
MTQDIDPKTRMHSAEHILNQTMVRMFDCGRCFSAHIEKKKSKCDYRFDRPLSGKELEEIETRVNGIIASNLPVETAFISKDEARITFNLERLPGEAGDTLRVVRMGDYDAVPCVGDHVTTTGQIGSFRIISSSFDGSVLRIRYKLDKPA